MKILVLHRKQPEDRKTINDHLYSFKRYLSNVDFFYCDVKDTLPFFLQWIEWDGIIIHYTLLAEKFSLDHKYSPYRHLPKKLSMITGYKVAIPQDEYFHTDAVINFFKNSRINSVFTCLPPSEYNKIYPLEKTGLKHRVTTLTGFVDENSLQKFHGPRHSKRSIDIGYRARKLPFWFGRHAQLKHEIGNLFLQINTSYLTCDISTEPQNTFYGDDWIEFIRNSRTMLGCLGGVSLFHPDSTIKQTTENYLQKYPNAPFDEVEQACFPGKDGNLKLFTLGPRHFECAMAKTCQVLIEGDYQGVFQPGTHYIELKKDFSNIKNVLEQVSNIKHCEEIAEKTYRDVVLSEKYTYRKFASDVIQHIRQNTDIQAPQRFRSFVVKCLLNIHTGIRSFILFLRKIKRRFFPK